MAGEGGLAEQIRVGLEDEEQQVVVSNKPVAIDPLDELLFRKPIRRHVAEFGFLFGAIGLVVAGISAWKGHQDRAIIFAAAGIIFALLGYKTPQILKPVWSGWMKFAHVLGAVMSTLLLSIGWIVLIIPFGLGARLFRLKLMNMEFRQNVPTYWETRDPKYDDFQLLKRQF